MKIYTYIVFAGRDFSLSYPVHRLSDVEISDQYWIGTTVSVRLGAVVGANSVIARSLPEVKIWDEVPAKFTRNKCCEHF
jgi:acetyltransferase-like isoleucine patch superfamily enzyme